MERKKIHSGKLLFYEHVSARFQHLLGFEGIMAEVLHEIATGNTSRETAICLVLLIFAGVIRNLMRNVVNEDRLKTPICLPLCYLFTMSYLLPTFFLLWQRCGHLDVKSRVKICMFGKIPCVHCHMEKQHIAGWFIRTFFAPVPLFATRSSTRKVSDSRCSFTHGQLKTHATVCL